MWRREDRIGGEKRTLVVPCCVASLKRRGMGNMTGHRSVASARSYSYPLCGVRHLLVHVHQNPCVWC